jgi:hypothetical protein
MIERRFPTLTLWTVLLALSVAGGCGGGGGHDDADADGDAVPDPAADDGLEDAPAEDVPVDTTPEGDVPQDPVDVDASDPANEDVPPDAEPDARPCPDCTAANACIAVEITRTAEEANLPWVVWPSEADGAGTLIVHAVMGSDVLARATVEDADMAPADARYEAPLCVAPGTVQVIVFLDDNGNAPADLVYSADYRDTCMGPGDCYRCVELTVAAGEDAAAEAVLYGSCD